MTEMLPEQVEDGEWQYPASKDVLRAAGLKSIAHYIKVRRQTIAAFIVYRPIFGLCSSRTRRQGASARRQFWWEQSFDLEEARAAGPVLVN